MKIALTLLALLLSTHAHAARGGKNKDVDPRPPVTFDAADGRVGLVTINGPVAQKLYEALQVESDFEFGLVQIDKKTLKNVECMQAVLGDNPETMSGPRYTCVLKTRLK